MASVIKIEVQLVRLANQEAQVHPGVVQVHLAHAEAQVHHGVVQVQAEVLVQEAQVQEAQVQEVQVVAEVMHVSKLTSNHLKTLWKPLVNWMV